MTPVINGSYILRSCFHGLHRRASCFVVVRHVGFGFELSGRAQFRWNQVQLEAGTTPCTASQGHRHNQQTARLPRRQTEQEMQRAKQATAGDTT